MNSRALAEPGHAPPRPQDAHRLPARPAPAPDSVPGVVPGPGGPGAASLDATSHASVPPPLRGPPGLLRRAALAGLLLAACRAPPAHPTPADELLRRAADLEVRADAYALASADEERFLRLAALACREACVAGVASFVVREGALECRCARPNIGVHAVSVEQTRGARGKGPRLLLADGDQVHELGAGGETDAAGAGLPPAAGGPP